MSKAPPSPDPEPGRRGPGASGVVLIPLGSVAAQATAAGEGPILSADLDAETAGLLRSVAAAHVELYRRTGAEAPWIGYVSTDASTGQPVGACSFKDACRGGAVEIAYFTFPAYEGLGWGRAMVSALVQLAWEQPEAQTLVAHTLPEENRSTRILRRLGFRFSGAVEDPEDGTVWRWTLPRPAVAGA